MQGAQINRLVLLALFLVLLVVITTPWITDLVIGYKAEPRAIQARGELAADERSNIEIFRSVSPSVVYITTSTRVLDIFTRDLTEIPQGTGTGLVWDRHGHIVTNYHVIQDARAATVRLSDHRERGASLVGVSPEHDLAVLRIDAAGGSLTPVPLGTSTGLQVGQKVLAIGNPFGLDQTLTTGVISALDRAIRAPHGGVIEHLIQTDAAINPGNSGGPLIDSAGLMIGMNTAILSSSGSYAGIGFAVPVDTVNRVVPRLIANGRYIRPGLGIIGDDAISEALLDGTGITGVAVLKVLRGSAAERAGLRPAAIDRLGDPILGDVILGVNGESVPDLDSLIEILGRHEVGETVTLQILRQGEVILIHVILGTGGAEEGPVRMSETSKAPRAGAFSVSDGGPISVQTAHPAGAAAPGGAGRCGAAAAAGAGDDVSAGGETVHRRIRRGVSGLDARALAQLAPGAQRLAHAVAHLEDAVVGVTAVIVGRHR